MGKNILNDEAKFLSVANSKIYIRILKIFYANYKFELKFNEGKEANANEIYDYCRETLEFKDVDRSQFENALEQLCDWGNLNSRPNLEVINRWEDFDKKTSLYSITNASLIFIKALEEFENKKIKDSTSSPVFLDRIIKNLKILKNIRKNDYDEKEINNSWEAIKNDFQTLDTNYVNFVNNFSNNNKTELEFNTLYKYKEDIKSNITEFLNVLDEKKYKIFPLVRDIDEKFEKILLPIITEKNIKDNLSSYEDEEIKNKNIWKYLREWFSNKKTSKSRRIMEETRQFLENLSRNINLYYDRENLGIDMKREYMYILDLFSSCNSKEEADKLFSYIFGINNFRHYKTFEDILVSDDSESTYKEENISFKFNKNKKNLKKRNEKKGRKEKTFEELEQEKIEYLKEIELENYIENEILKEKIDTEDFSNKILVKEVVYLLQDLYYQGFINEKNIALTSFGKKYKVDISENDKTTLVCEEGTYIMPRCHFYQMD